ncbi:hypothetical protein [Nakamurella sp.]|uniref:hypothetical protein n=1 Tax=Nakamurella sp. TaxID=1869182 RepID=UPI003B3AE848
MAVADQPDAVGSAPGSVPESTPPPAAPDPGPVAEPDPAAVAVLDRAAGELGRATDQEPSAGLVPAVMHSVWAELRPGQLLELPGSDGRLLVGAAAVATAITGRLDDLADLVVRRCTVESADPGPGSGPVAPGAGAAAVRVTLTAAVAYGADTGELADEVRTTVATAARELFGLTVDRVDLVVEDVFVAGGAP